MERIAEFFAMGGHAGYIWPAFAVALLALVVLLLTTIRGWRQSEAILKTLRQQRRRPRPRPGTEGEDSQ